ncbi:MAG: DNA recombination protein RmuC, partial [Candidatus Marinimicrobia bacterium]|nr:DNA recombination protein RmuC [Candidatus Neomarinimicrobiota bacterium]
MNSEIILFIIGFVLGGGLIWFLRQKELDSVMQNREEIRQTFGDLSNEVLVESQKNFLELAEHKFSALLENSDEQLDKKKELIDSTLKDMKDRLKNLSENTVGLKSQMEESRKSIGDLSNTTIKLRQILSSSQARGQWGERMVEDILNFIGLTEGINFKQQEQAGKDRPDFTFFLPDEKMINMDVKFPLNHYEKYIEADTDTEKESEKKAFL